MRRCLLVMSVVLVAVAGCARAFDRPREGDRPWSTVAAGPLSARHDALGVWDGRRFVVVGGSAVRPCPPEADCMTEPTLSDGAAFDPATGAWQVIAAAPVPLGPADIVAVPSGTGRVYVLSWSPGDDKATAFLSYDGDRDAWTSLPPPPVAGRLLDAGGALVGVAPTDEHGTTVDAAFDPATGAWRALPDDPLGPSYDRMAVWAGDRLLLGGRKLVPNPGATEPSLLRLTTLDATLTTWTAPTGTEILGSGPAPAGAEVVWTGTGSADGGQIGNWGRSYAEGGILTPSTGSWRPLPSAPRPAGPLRADPPITTGGRVAVGGHLLAPATGDWLRVPDLPDGPRFAATVVGGPGLVLVWGGALEKAPEHNLATGFLLRA